QPAMNERRLVRGVVVQDEMYVQVARHFSVYAVQEPTKLRGAMATMHFTDHLAGCHIQCSEQRRSAVTLVIISASLDLTGPHWQDRLRPIEGLDLALLVGAQHQCPFGRVEVQADNIANLLDQLWVGRQLERFGTMRLKTKGAPDAMHSLFGHTRR